MIFFLNKFVFQKAEKDIPKGIVPVRKFFIDSFKTIEVSIILLYFKLTIDNSFFNFKIIHKILFPIYQQHPRSS